MGDNNQDGNGDTPQGGGDGAAMLDGANQAASSFIAFAAIVNDIVAKLAGMGFSVDGDGPSPIEQLQENVDTVQTELERIQGLHLATMKITVQKNSGRSKRNSDRINALNSDINSLKGSVGADNPAFMTERDRGHSSSNDGQHQIMQVDMGGD